MSKSKLLIVDDDEEIRTQLKYALRDEYELSFAGDSTSALRALHEFPPDVITLDLGLPPSPELAQEGLRLLEEILRLMPAMRVVVVTGNADRAKGISAVQLGAFDYCLKPIDIETLRVILRRAVHLHELQQEGEAESQSEERAARFEEILGVTPTMQQIFRVIHRVARTDMTVLIQGESGTGKELIANAIHRRSPRRSAPFVAINCGAIPDTLLEGELFGHERGAFTGAHVQRKGRLELANQGTLFLDEIGELTPMLQVKLLRFLQDRTIERIGGRELIGVDSRVVAATNRDLKAEIGRSTFREDLYYRLSVVTITVPPLRDRGEDVVLIANAFLGRTAREHRRHVRFSGAALEAMMSYPWPGNIRELENRVSRAVIMTSGRVIEPVDLELASPATEQPRAGSLREVRDRVEREVLIGALLRHRGNISQAARELAVSRPTLHDLLDKHGVDPKGFRSG
jgi:two-component system, NtrC family, response regulator